jgi:hypothetical protein
MGLPRISLGASDGGSRPTPDVVACSQIVPLRTIVTLQVTGEADSARDVLQRVGLYTREHFDDRFTFDPYIDESGHEVVWLASAEDEHAMAEWEAEMGDKTGFRAEVMGVMQFTRIYLLDSSTHPHLELLRQVGTALVPVG